MDDPRDDAGPARLVAGAKSRPIVSVKVLVKQNVVAPVWICLELVRAAVHRPSARLVFHEDSGEPATDNLGYLIQRHVLSRSRGALDLKTVAIVSVVLQQCTDDQRIDRHPDGTAPIRVATE